MRHYYMHKWSSYGPQRVRQGVTRHGTKDKCMYTKACVTWDVWHPQHNELVLLLICGEYQNEKGYE